MTDGPLAIMGGAFDPVHVGHLRTALEMQAAFGLAEVRLVPSANPPHRPPHFAAPELRVRMLAAATVSLPGVTVDQREIERAGPSYSVLTLEELRSEIGNRSLCMILGMDAFLGLADWHRWTELAEFAHLLIAQRPGSELPATGKLGEFVQARRSDNVDDLHATPAGKVFVHPVTQLDISSSAVREQLQNGETPRYLLSDEVLDIVLETECYTRESARLHREAH